MQKSKSPERKGAVAHKRPSPMKGENSPNKLMHPDEDTLAVTPVRAKLAIQFNEMYTREKPQYATRLVFENYREEEEEELSPSQIIQKIVDNQVKILKACLASIKISTKEVNVLKNQLRDLKGKEKTEAHGKLKEERTNLEEINENFFKTLKESIILLQPEKFEAFLTSLSISDELFSSCLLTYNYIEALGVLSKHEQILSANTRKLMKEIPTFKSALDQLKLENNLQQLGMIYCPITTQFEANTCTRIIFTTQSDVEIGFRYLIEYVEHVYGVANKECIVANLRRVGVWSVINHLLEKHGAKLDMSALEVAWYHVMNAGKHKENQVVFVQEMLGLEVALKSCSENSILVINGHGGGNEFTLGSDKLRANKLQSFIEKIAGMINDKITHVVLAACCTGVLRNDVPSDQTHVLLKYQPADVTKNGLLKFKNRQKLFTPLKGECISEMFETTSTSSSSFAALLAQAVLNRKNIDESRGTAFTFSTSMLAPLIQEVDSVIGSRGVPMGIGDVRLNWPSGLVEWDQDFRVSGAIANKKVEQIAFKSVTLFDNMKNDKAFACANDSSLEWKKPRFVSQ